MLKRNSLPGLWFLIFLLAGCLPAVPTLPHTPVPPILTPSLTVPPLPSPTSWSTRTPLPTDTPTSTPLPCWGAGGSLLEDTIETALLDRPVEILVYLPPCYAQLTELSYPALYLIHGQGFDRYQWPQLGLIDLVDKWTINGEVPPFLIVMPEVGDWGEPDVFPFGQALVEEIIPRIEGDYRALPKRGFRKVGGISRGAGWALHLGLNYWETFSALGAHSLPVFYSDAPMIPYWLESIPPNQHPGIYLDYAESDMSPIRRSINKLIEQLEARGFEYQFFTAPGIHNQEYWRGNIEEYLRFYLTGW